MAQPRSGKLPAVNRIFVNRDAAIRVFENAVFSIPKDRSSLCVFYGAGGQGKTALMRELMRRTEVAVEPSYGFLRRAELDLHDRLKDDADRLLVWIRNEFADTGVVFPCFDLAFAIYWEATRGDEPFPTFTKRWLKRTTTIAEAGIDELASRAKSFATSDDVKELAGDLVGSIPGVGFFIKYIGKWIIEKGKRAYLEKSQPSLKCLFDDDGDIKKPHELSGLLPWMLAQDLNAHLDEKSTERFVLLIDEYERVFDQGGASARWEEIAFDSHLRSLISEANGLLAVFFTREKLPWQNSVHWREDLDGKQHLINGLTTEHAEAYLSAIPIDDKLIRSAIIEGAYDHPKTAPSAYPLLLALQVEHMRELVARDIIPLPGHFVIAATTFEDRLREIVSRLLRDYDRPLQVTLEHLSVGRRFDSEAFRFVVQHFETALPLDQFSRIVELSFVTPGKDGFFSLHSIVAEAICQILPSEVRSTSIKGLLGHYEGRVLSTLPKDVTDSTISALLEAVRLRITQGPEAYAAWLTKITFHIHSAARYVVLTALWRKAFSLIEKELGPDHHDTIQSLTSYADLLAKQSDLSSARTLFERAFETRERILGINHSDTIRSLNNLAGIVWRQGDLITARRLFERALVSTEITCGADHPETALILNNLGSLLSDLDDLEKAQTFLERSLAIRLSCYGEKHIYTLSTMNNLAGVRQERGAVGAARVLYERVLTIQGQLFGLDHPTSAVFMNNLGQVLKSQADFVGARLQFQKALQVQTTHLGEMHSETATTVNNLAELLAEEGDLQGAIMQHERAFAIRQGVLGDYHSDTAMTLSNLGGLLVEQGDLTRAEQLLCRARNICEKALGENHRYTAVNLVKIASLRREQGRLSCAQECLERALAILGKSYTQDHIEIGRVLRALGNIRIARHQQGARALLERSHEIVSKALDPKHPEMALSLYGLASLAAFECQYVHAHELLVQSLEIQEAVLPANHRDRLKTRELLARTLHNIGKFGDAKRIFRDVLAILENVLEPGNPDTAQTLNDLAKSLQALGELDEARLLFERARGIRENVLGPEHPDTGISLNDLGTLLIVQGDIAGAKEVLERALAIFEKVHGLDHPETAIACANLAGVFAQQGKFLNAERLYKRGLSIEQKIFGSEHLRVVRSLNNIGVNYMKQGLHETARPILERALTIRKAAFGLEHPDTAMSLFNFGQVLKCLGEFDLAREKVETALKVRIKVFGLSHPLTIVAQAELSALQGGHS